MIGKIVNRNTNPHTTHKKANGLIDNSSTFSLEDFPNYMLMSLGVE